MDIAPARLSGAQLPKKKFNCINIHPKMSVSSSSFLIYWACLMCKWFKIHIHQFIHHSFYFSLMTTGTVKLLTMCKHRRPSWTSSLCFWTALLSSLQFLHIVKNGRTNSLHCCTILPLLNWRNCTTSWRVMHRSKWILLLPSLVQQFYIFTKYSLQVGNIRECRKKWFQTKILFKWFFAIKHNEHSWVTPW